MTRALRLFFLLGLLAMLATGCFGGSRTLPGWSGVSTDGETVYYASSAGMLYGIDLVSGNQLWSYPVDDKDASGPFYAEPVLADGFALVGSTDNTLYVVDQESGQLRWRFEAEGGILGAVAVADGVVYVPSADAKLYALQLANGVKIWEFETGNWNWVQPAVGDGLVYLGSMDHNLYALDADTGTLVWKRYLGAAIAGAPTLTDGVIYVGALDSRIHAVDAASGEPLWAFEVERKPFLNWELPAGRWFWGQPLVLDGVVYVGSLDGNVYAIDADSGELAWSYEAGSPIRAGLVQQGALLYALTEDGNLTALDMETRQARWISALGGDALAKPAASDELVFASTSTGELIATDQFGNERWRFPKD
jgi:outer membrane protein assembly factor BamB